MCKVRGLFSQSRSHILDQPRLTYSSSDIHYCHFTLLARETTAPSWSGQSYSITKKMAHVKTAGTLSEYTELVNRVT